MITENRKSHQLCTGSKLAKITGLELCGVMEFPNASMKADAPYFPLTGPVSVEVAMFKRDTHKSYKIQSNLINVCFSSLMMNFILMECHAYFSYLS